MYASSRSRSVLHCPMLYSVYTFAAIRGNNPAAQLILTRSPRHTPAGHRGRRALRQVVVGLATSTAWEWGLLAC